MRKRLSSGKINLFFSALVCIAVFGCNSNVTVVPDAPPTSYDSNKFDADLLATQWFDCAAECVQNSPGFSEPVAARAYAYIGMALYESMLPGLPKDYSSLAGQLNNLTTLPKPDTAGKRFHWTIVANATIAEVMRSLFVNAPSSITARIDSLEKVMLAERADRSGDAYTTDRSLQFGKKLGVAISQYAAADGGADADKDNFATAIGPSTDSSYWIPTTNNPNPMLTHWGSNRCFFVTTGDLATSLDPGPFPTFSSVKNSEFYKTASEVRSTVMSLHPDDKLMVRYWNGETQSPMTLSTHMIRIVTQVLRTKAYRMNLGAILYARVAMAMNDACVACYAAKYKYPLMRPVSYVQRYIDKSWTTDTEVLPLSTPPSPEYCSASAAVANAAVGEIRSMLGESYLFTDRSQTSIVFTERDYYSFDQILSEVRESQLQSGTQFRFSVDAGINLGRRVSEIAQTRLQFGNK